MCIIVNKGYFGLKNDNKHKIMGIQGAIVSTFEKSDYEIKIFYIAKKS